MTWRAPSPAQRTALLAALVLATVACGEESEAPAEDRGPQALEVGLPIEERPEDDPDGDPPAGDEGQEPIGNEDPPEPDTAPEPDPLPEPDPAPEPDPPPPAGQQCSVWQDCGPLYADPNSGMECVAQTCQCDPAGQWQATCASMSGTWVASACQCVFTDVPPPGNDPGDGCYWDLEQPPCDPDQWVDTSHYEQDCYYDSYDNWVCDPVWVESGYYEPGACPSPYWIERC